MAKTKVKRRIFWAALGAIGAAVVVIISLNLSPREQELQHRLQHVSAVDSVQFRREIGTLLGASVTEDNAIADYQNGAEYFPAMLAAIRGAQRSVNMETYIYWSGDIARAFADALIERARAGVKVHVLADWVGSSKMKHSLVERLRAGGVRFEYFHPLHWYTLDRINNRTHRKLLIVDGKIAFNGGAGIADAWNGNATRPDHWRDMEFRVEGPAASQMQAIFADNWLAATGEVLLGDAYYPAPPRTGNTAVQAFASSPEGGSINMQLLYLMAINGARHSIDLEAAYFIPDELTQTALLDALHRGVKVRIVVPGGHVDSPLARSASQQTWGMFMKAGARFFEFQPTLFHNKLMVVDSYLTIGGSANFDDRSFKLNDESNLNIPDRAFATHMTGVIDGDIARSREVTLAQWQDRPWTRRVADWLSTLGSSQL
ncbi:MAG TPA: phospholipase D-like domain-containing protein [Rhodanobacteraceae bacterium]|nr:phospholipase D-like domain-containing protein [Rhodanobacteraceae bacterium]